MPSLKAIYCAEAADIALTRLEEFAAEWAEPSQGFRQAKLDGEAIASQAIAEVRLAEGNLPFGSATVFRGQDDDSWRF